MSNIKYNWVFNNNYNTRQLANVKVKKTKMKGGLLGGGNGSGQTSEEALCLLINGSSIGNFSPLGGTRWILGDQSTGGKYIRFDLTKTCKFSFDIDLSRSAGGVNAAFYFVPMGINIQIPEKTASSLQNIYAPNPNDPTKYKKQGDADGAELYPSSIVESTCYWQSSRIIWGFNYIKDEFAKKVYKNLNNKFLSGETTTLELLGLGYNDAQRYGDFPGSIEIDCFESSSVSAQVTLHLDVLPTNKGLLKGNDQVLFDIGYSGRSSAGVGGTPIQDCSSNKIAPFAVNLKKINGEYLDPKKAEYYDMHGVYANISGLSNTNDHPDPLGSGLFGEVSPNYLNYGPGEKYTINTQLPYNVSVSTDFSENEFKLCVMLTQKVKDVTKTVKFNKRQARVTSEYMKSQLNKMCFIISYWQTSNFDKIGQATTWWMDGVNNTASHKPYDIRGPMLNYPTLNPNLPNTILGENDITKQTTPSNEYVKDYQKRDDINDAQKKYDYSIIGQSHIDNGKINKDITPSILLVSNLNFSKATTKPPKPTKPYLCLDVMYRGIDYYIDPSIPDINQNYHGSFCGSYGAFACDKKTPFKGTLNVNDPKADPLNDGRNFNEGFSGLSPENGRDPKNYLTNFFNNVRYIGLFEDTMYSNWHNWNENKLFNTPDGTINNQLCYTNMGSIISFTQ